MKSTQNGHKQYSSFQVAAPPMDAQPHGVRPRHLAPVGPHRPDITSGVPGFFILLGVLCGAIVVVILYRALRNAAPTPVIPVTEEAHRDVELQVIVPADHGEMVLVEQPGGPTPTPMWRVLQK